MGYAILHKECCTLILSLSCLGMMSVLDTSGFVITILRKILSFAGSNPRNLRTNTFFEVEVVSFADLMCRILLIEISGKCKLAAMQTLLDSKENTI